jgi:hypothetical protein
MNYDKAICSTRGETSLVRLIRFEELIFAVSIRSLLWKEPCFILGGGGGGGGGTKKKKKKKKNKKNPN